MLHVIGIQPARLDESYPAIALFHQGTAFTCHALTCKAACD